ncbi:cytidine deaminase [bacterium]|nr:cytidine deaminase [bacterium]
MDKEREYLSILKDMNRKAYAPYSNFKVSALLVTKSGKIYTGINVENASYGGTVCAERVAIFKAVSEGDMEFEKIYIYSTDKDGNHKITPPCGFCRQVMVEFSKDMKIILVAENETIETDIETLQPFLFDETYLK